VNLWRRHPTRLLAALACLVGPAARGGPEGIQVAIMNGPPPPLHPTLILAHYQQGRQPVVDVIGGAGLIEEGGKGIRLPAKTTFEAARANAFAPGSLEVAVKDVSSSQLRREWSVNHSAPIDGGIMAESTHFECRAVPSQGYRDCYLVLLFFFADFLSGQSDEAGQVVAFERIGDLAPGAETKVKADFGYLDFGNRAYSFVPLFFTRGREIRTNYADNAAMLFRQVEMRRHQRLVTAYLRKHPRDTTAAVAYVRFAPVFAPGFDPATLPERIRAGYTVATDGTVEGIEFAPAVPAEAVTGIRRALGGWLYLPRLRNGEPVSTAMATDFIFKAPAPAAPGG
jgi:hypothetical protein